MPRYFFHVESGARFHDDPGVAMAGPENARSEAVLAVGEMLRDIDGEFPGGPEWRMHVVDEDGVTVCALTIKGE